jgi:hypothetical protein
MKNIISLTNINNEHLITFYYPINELNFTLGDKVKSIIEGNPYIFKINGFNLSEINQEHVIVSAVLEEHERDILKLFIESENNNEKKIGNVRFEHYMRNLKFSEVVKSVVVPWEL